MATTQEKDLEKELDLEEEIIEEEPVSIDIPSFAPEGGGSKVLDFWEKNKVILGGGLAAIMLGVGGYFFYQSTQEDAQKEADEQMIHAFRWYEQDSLDKAIKGTSQHYGLEKIANEYSGTKAGNVGKYMLGTAYLAKGKVDNGVQYLEDYSKDKDMVSATACAALAYGYEEKKDFAAAAEQYLKAAETVKNVYTSPDFILQAARCYETAKNNEKALALYKDLAKNYPNSDAGRKADKYIAKLSTE